MNPLALINRGAPPAGLGAYLRADAQPNVSLWRFRAVNAARADYAQVASQARSYGRVWMYSMPNVWVPSNWRNELERIYARTIEVGAEGFIVDCENEWPGLGNAERAREFEALGARMVEMARDVRVGFTSFPNLPGIDVLGRVAGGHIFATPQIYGIDANDAATFQRWFDKWVATFGRAHVIPSIAAWVSGPALSTPERYRAYLAQLPRAGGAIAWTTGTPPSWMQAELARYSPGGNALATVLLAGASYAARPVFLVALIVVVVFVVALREL